MNEAKQGVEWKKPNNLDLKYPNKLDANQRWSLYFYWVNLYKERLIIHLEEEDQTYRREYKRYLELKEIQDIQLMKDMDVIGNYFISLLLLHL